MKGLKGVQQGSGGFNIQTQEGLKSTIKKKITFALFSHLYLICFACPTFALSLGQT